eukprot:GDKK01030249.1.p2 GENE.GDKK01030249.1~~GDKK01030249.1.p2  ORF type:complete len:114 (+),score=5.83 GDKK01030249.1:167-508(+)
MHATAAEDPKRVTLDNIPDVKDNARFENWFEGLANLLGICEGFGDKLAEHQHPSCVEECNAEGNSGAHIRVLLGGEGLPVADVCPDEDRHCSKKASCDVPSKECYLTGNAKGC